jgi:hypothetical protein
MAGQLVTPPAYLDLDGPLIFLAGPIQGTSDWQSAAIQIIHQLAPEIHIANPRRELLNEKFDSDAQIEWDTHYLRRAAQEGAILFWLASEEFPISGRTFAQTTRFELAEWKMRHERDGARLAVGISPDFSGRKYIKKRFSQDCPSVPLSSTLQATCEFAVQLALEANAEASWSD